MRRSGKIRVGVLFGGRSGEHQISLRSALTVIGAMDPRRYEIVPISIDRDGRWFLREDAIATLTAATPKLRALGRGGAPVTLAPEPRGGALTTGSGDGAGSAASVRLDVIFPVLHGTYGEDGTIQGLLELAGIPYVGAGVLGSALGMDKDAQKLILRASGIPVVRHFAITRAQLDDDPALARRRAAELGYPIFVKPNALGSSIGVSRVANQRALAAALADALRYDRKVLLEESCAGREFECAVLGNDRPEASVPGEIVVTGHQFYSYESKYVDPEGAATRIPADLPAAIAAQIRALSIAAFAALGLRGMARVDFLARPDLGEIFVNEVNTIPGFTSISMYPKLWEASGLPLPKLLDRLIELARAEFRERSRLKYVYQPPLRERRAAR